MIYKLTQCLLMPFETHRQITVEANVAGGYIDTGNINVSINLPWMLPWINFANLDNITPRFFFDLQ